MFEYLPIYIFTSFSFLLSSILIIISFIASSDFVEQEKLSTYECGFNPFEDARKTYDIKFYVVAMVFIIFDVEVALLLPWVFVAFSLVNVATLGVFLFLFLLVLGFVYEWEKAVLDWA